MITVRSRRSPGRGDGQRVSVLLPNTRTARVTGLWRTPQLRMGRINNDLRTPTRDSTPKAIDLYYEAFTWSIDAAAMIDDSSARSSGWWCPKYRLMAALPTSFPKYAAAI